MTPAPTYAHQAIASRLARILYPYVEREGLGMVWQPRAVMRHEGSEVEPDLMVRAEHPGPNANWDNAPVPLLVVETLSPSTRRRDREQKRSLYMAAGVEQYWMIDPELREVTVVQLGVADVIAREELIWMPTGAAHAFTLRVDQLFG